MKGLLALDETADNSKDFTVPTGVHWDVTSVSLRMVTTATAGNRLIVVELVEGASVILLAISNRVQTASTTLRYVVGPGVADLQVGTPGDSITVPAPFPVRVRAGQTLRVRDVGNISATDDMEVYVFGEAIYAGAMQTTVVAKTS